MEIHKESQSIIEIEPVKISSNPDVYIDEEDTIFKVRIEVSKRHHLYVTTEGDIITPFENKNINFKSFTTALETFKNLKL